jgi:hypothetical protein
MTNQQLRIFAALILTNVALAGVVVLLLAGHAVPTLLEYVAIASIAFLFGVSTNGSGSAQPPKHGGPR